MPAETVLSELLENAGIQFDPELVILFIKNILGKKSIEQNISFDALSKKSIEDKVASMLIMRIKIGSSSCN